MQQHQLVVKKVATEDIEELLAFISNARHTLFPGMKFRNTILAEDVAHWIKTGHFLTVYTKEQHLLVATIGFVPYDHRFSHLDFNGRKTVEVVRLFVLPQYRRSGLGNMLFNSLRKEAEGSGTETMYLHTHPFLPGAVEFWTKLGFQVIDVEEDEVWPTVHMKLDLRGYGS